MASTPALERLQEIGPVFRSKEALAAGVSWRDLYDLRDRGEVLELSRGLFQLAAAGIGNIDFVTVCPRAPHGMIALDSALSYWDLTDQVPSTVHLRGPRRLASPDHRPPADNCPRIRRFDVRARTKDGDRRSGR